jgi:hypothetical protein
MTLKVRSIIQWGVASLEPLLLERSVQTVTLASRGYAHAET